MKILHIISGLNSGGAEGVLCRLVLNDKKNTHYVVSLTNKGFYGRDLAKNNIFLKSLQIKKNFFILVKFIELIFLIRNIKPDVVQCWMYHAELFGGLAAKFSGIRKIFWNIRNSDLNPIWSKKSTIYLAKLCSHLSNYVPKKIISCSKKSTKTHVDMGYKRNKILFIPNGFDDKKFKFKLQNYLNWREKLKISKKIVVFGFVGRWNSQKDFETLFKAFSNFLAKNNKKNNFKLLLIGSQLNSSNIQFLRLIKKYNLKKNIIYLDETNKINEVINIIDIGIFSSKGNEGFPNVIAEKMLSKIPCIVSDVGDASIIVGNTGWVFKKGDWSDLSDKIRFVYDKIYVHKLKWNIKRNASRNRIKNNFSLNKMVKEYHKIWTK
ncbi:MAG: hypothetical protein CBD97_02450 [Pelagibacteraceae bacterium TMED237]|nr:MAG: hypothetical protein CBD97_02450 [Pelagibacteraceae bacterium TMED237]